jgi:hypothetical protein
MRLTGHRPPKQSRSGGRIERGTVSGVVMWRWPLCRVLVTVSVTPGRSSCAPLAPGWGAAAQSNASWPRMRRAWLQRTAAPRRAPRTRSSRSHTMPSRRCARFPADHPARAADQAARDHGRRRTRAAVHRHPRRPPHKGIDPDASAPAGSSPGRTQRHVAQRSRCRGWTRFPPITTRHSTIRPAAPTSAEQPQQGCSTPTS